MNIKTSDINELNTFFQNYPKHIQGMQGFGSLNEKTTHAVLKSFYAGSKDNEEVMVDGFIADVFCDGQIVEIQTKQFGHLKKKLSVFLPKYPVKIIYPFSLKNTIHWIDPVTGEESPNKRASKRGSVYNVFEEVFRILEYMKDPNLSITVLLLETEETRLLDGYRKDKKVKATKIDRYPVKVMEKYEFTDYRDFYSLIPIDLNTNFTVKDFAKSANIPESTASISLRVFYELGLVNRIGKGTHGAYIYEINEV